MWKESRVYHQTTLFEPWKPLGHSPTATLNFYITFWISESWQRQYLRMWPLNNSLDLFWFGALTMVLNTQVPQCREFNASKRRTGSKHSFKCMWIVIIQEERYYITWASKDEETQNVYKKLTVIKCIEVKHTRQLFRWYCGEFYIQPITRFAHRNEFRVG